MPRILVLDTYYPDVLAYFDAVHPEWAALSYAACLQAVLDELFGTADFYSRNLRSLGWDATDVIANYPRLQGPGDPVTTVLRQIDEFRPDVLFLQDFKVLPPAALAQLQARGIVIAAQLSCPMPPPECVRSASIIFTSFPHYVARLRQMGVRRPVYSALACEPTAITRALAGRELPARDLDVLFVGGVGKQIHWRAGTTALEAVARELGPRFHWYGYGRQYLEPESPLHAAYRGGAWGRQMYELLLRAKVVVNRHGEVAEGYANNMRVFEATSAGALLITEAAPNLTDFFDTTEVLAYGAGELPQKVRWALDHPLEVAMMAAKAQMRALTEHTYYRKMQQVDAVLREELGQ